MRHVIYALGILFVIVLAVSGLYGAWMIRHGFSTRTPPGAVESAVAESMRDLAIPSRYRSLKNPVTTSPDVLQQGMAHWADHCAICHANNGSGETMYGKTLYPRPPDMRRKGTQEMSDGALYFTIQNGIMLSGMPAFGTPGDNDLDSWKLVAFIRHLPELSQTEESQMGKMNPKSPDELKEEKEEENFLQGGPADSKPVHPHQH